MLNVCITCEQVYCEPCGGAVGPAPLPAFRCCRCLLSEYEERDALRDCPPEAAAARRAVLLGLVRGRMLILSQRKRKTTLVSYASGRRALLRFAEAHHLSPYPPWAGLIMDWGVHELVTLKLDSSTVRLHFTAIHDIIDYSRSRLGLRSLSNPLRDPEAAAFANIVDANYKKKSKARTSISLVLAKALILHGWVLDKPPGLWGRLRWVFLNFGMLRVGCVNSLLVCYEIEISADGEVTVKFLDDSDIKILYNDMLKEQYISVNVDVDKNVRAWNRRTAVIPFRVELLDALPVQWLTEYIKYVRPPSGGRLFARPTKKGFAKTSTNASKDIKDAYTRSCAQLGIPVDKEILPKLGTHSGRKSLAQWLWDDGQCRRVIADAGGWFLKRDAVDMYFKTATHIILKAVRDIGKAFD